MQRRLLSAAASAVRATAKGPARQVLKLDKLPPLAASLGPSHVSLKMLVAPIHPVDTPAVLAADSSAFLGVEGLAEVSEVGSGVTSLQKGDWVVPQLGFGTWRTAAVAEEGSLMRVPKDIPASYAATLVHDLSTAYRLLRDFQKLAPGDVIMQNDASSPIGIAVIQLAREMGLRTINIISSDRPEGDTVLRLLTNLGGDVNVTDGYVNSYGLNQIMADLPACKLALDAIGGDVVTHMSRALASQGTIASYEGKPQQPIVVPPEFLSGEGGKKVTLQSFSMAKWYTGKPAIDRAVMFADLAHLIRSNKLTCFHEVHDFDDFGYALERSLEPFTLRKVLLNLDYPDRLKEHDALPASAYEVFETTTV